ncbi:hypothetical protein GM661_00430 [Iocasia frigidifontis]|uniref:Uncharacterized protein n=1 Tax=Iocasia fonsfrigidae TaxID=2682810 RepID=A0A8A7KB25_9FIRM|nr:hypothetical protein [Iocasia fonsfrigidae]QTL96539.1 hypothetical protein GM661_00430 [Iocasia fonsfrigidae]
MKRKALIVTDCSFNGEGCQVFLDDYETKEQAYEALHQAVMEYATYGAKEIEIDTDKEKFRNGRR